jgi:hypothetical protein
MVPPSQRSSYTAPSMSYDVKWRPSRLTAAGERARRTWRSTRARWNRRTVHAVAILLVLVVVVGGPCAAGLAAMGAALLQEQRWDAEDGSPGRRRDRLVLQAGTAAAAVACLVIAAVFVWLATAPG